MSGFREDSDNRDDPNVSHSGSFNMAAFHNPHSERHVRNNQYTPTTDLTNYQDDSVWLCKPDKVATHVSVW